MTSSEGSAEALLRELGPVIARYITPMCSQSLTPASPRRTLRQLKLMTDWVKDTYPNQGSHLKLVEDKANGPAVIAARPRRG